MFTFVVALLVCHWKRLTRGIARGCVLVSEHSWKISECRIITPAPYFQPFPTLNIYTLHLILPFLDTHRIRYYASGAHHCHVSICIGAWRMKRRSLSGRKCYRKTSLARAKLWGDAATAKVKAVAHLGAMYASVGEPKEFSAQKKAVLPFDKEFPTLLLKWSHLSWKE